MAAGDGGGLEHHIAAAGAADGVLPVVEFTVVAVGQCEPAPGLPLNLAPQQADGAANHEQHGQNGQQNAADHAQCADDRGTLPRKAAESLL